MTKSLSMPQVDETFFTVVGCMDGRVQDVVAEFGRQKFGAKYPDTITEAGLVGKLPLKDQALLDAVKFKVVDVSIGKHHARGVIVHGHAECAGNPVDDERQRDDIKKSVEVMKTLVGSVPVIGVFVYRSDTDPTRWLAEEITS